MSPLKPSCASYILTGTVAVVLSWMMSGCRIGNHASNTFMTATDPISGLYATRPMFKSDSASVPTLSSSTGATPPTTAGAA